MRGATVGVARRWTACLLAGFALACATSVVSPLHALAQTDAPEANAISIENEYPDGDTPGPLQEWIGELFRTIRVLQLPYLGVLLVVSVGGVCALGTRKIMPARSRLGAFVAVVALALLAAAISVSLSVGQSIASSVPILLPVWFDYPYINLLGIAACWLPLAVLGAGYVTGSKSCRTQVLTALAVAAGGSTLWFVVGLLLGAPVD